jgi:hypothetical protein
MERQSGRRLIRAPDAAAREATTMIDREHDTRPSLYPPVATVPPPDTFTREESEALYALRYRYLQGHDLLSRRELERLRFLRWLYDTGRLES